MLQLFHLPAPQKIGSVTAGTTLGEIRIRPLIGLQARLSAQTVFETPEEYICFLADCKRVSWSIGSDQADIDKARVVIDQLETIILQLLFEMPQPWMRRCMFCHTDPNPCNFLVDDGGRLTGVVDWEFQAVLPVVLCTEFPEWFFLPDLDKPANSRDQFSFGSTEEIGNLRQCYLDVRICLNL